MLYTDNRTRVRTPKHSPPANSLTQTTNSLRLEFGRSEKIFVSNKLVSDSIYIPLRPTVAAISVDGESMMLRVPPHTICYFSAKVDLIVNSISDSDGFFITLEPDFYDEIMTHFGKQRSLNRSNKIEMVAHPDISTLSQSLFRHVSFPECPNEPFLDLLVGLMMYRFLWSCYSEQSELKQPALFTSARLHEVLETIESQLDSRIYIGKLADKFSMSLSQFSRAFKKSMAMTPQQYVTERRVQKVKNLIETTTSSLTEIALEAGFCSQAHMTSAFSTQLGLTPGEYRKHLAHFAGRSENKPGS